MIDEHRSGAIDFCNKILRKVTSRALDTDIYESKIILRGAIAIDQGDA
jgi:hypothetical protein